MGSEKCTFGWGINKRGGRTSFRGVKMKTKKLGYLGKGGASFRRTKEDEKAQGRTNLNQSRRGGVSKKGSKSAWKSESFSCATDVGEGKPGEKKELVRQRLPLKVPRGGEKKKAKCRGPVKSPIDWERGKEMGKTPPRVKKRRGGNGRKKGEKRLGGRVGPMVLEEKGESWGETSKNIRAGVGEEKAGGGS